MVGCRAVKRERRVRSASGVAVASLLLPLVVVLAMAPTAEAAKLVENDGQLPSARVGSAAVNVGNGIVYVFGGRDGKEYFDEIVKYDAKTGKSEVVGQLPMPVGFTKAGRQAMPAVWTGEKAYIFGGAALKSAGDLNGDGTEDFVPASIPDIVEFDPATNQAKRLLGDQLPGGGAWGIGAVWANGKAYLFGGYTFDLAAPASIGRHDWILSFDPAATTGTKVKFLDSSLPFKNQDMATVLVENKVWMFGGLGDNNTANPCPLVEVFDEETNQTRMVHMQQCATAKILWMDLNQQVPQLARVELPYRSQFSAAAAIDEKVYVFGGRATDGSAFASVQEFDTAEQKIGTMHLQFKFGRFGMPAVREGATDILILGGRDAGDYRNGMIDVVRFVGGATEPMPPREVTARSAQDGSSITVTWSPPSYDGGAAVTSYNVYRAIGREAPTLLEKVAGGLSFRDDAATPGTTYTYIVRAENKFGESVNAPIEVQAGTRPPSAPTGFRAFAGDGFALLRWLPPTDDGGSDVGAYRIYRDDGAKPYAEVAATAREYRDESVTNGVTYSYTVSAVNGKGEGARALQKTATPALVPDAPTGLTVEASGEAILLRWSGAAGAEGYRVYRGTEPYLLESVGEEIVRGTEYLDEGVARGRVYYYAVAPLNVNGEGAWSETASGGLIDPPSAPLNLLVTPGPGFVELKWVAPRDLGGADKVTYIVKRTGPDGQTRAIAVGLADAKYTDHDVIPGSAYTYSITASNGRTGPAGTEKTATPLDIVNEPPVAAVQRVGEIRTKVGDEVTFDASLSTDVDGRIVSYEFNFGDGSRPLVTDKPEAKWSYKYDGCFKAHVNVTDDLGARSAVPAIAPVYVGNCGEGDKEKDETDLTYVTPTTKEDAPPGSKTPAPGALGALVAAAAAVAMARRRRA